MYKIQAKILLIENLSGPIIKGSQVLLHIHNLDVTAIICKIISVVNKKDRTIISRPKFLTGGTNVFIEIALEEPICVETFSHCRALG